MRGIKVAALALTLLAGGCTSAPEIYTLPEARFIDQQLEVPEDYEQIERGRPNWLLDGINHYLFSLPTKLVLLDWQVLDHELPKENELVLRHYLGLNQLRSVKVRHNQYAPLAEFRRLRSNTEVGLGYRYSLGIVAWLRYTLFPQRVFAGLPLIGVGDNFNPFTNTINVYSSNLAVLLHEAGHSKDYLQHERRGTAAAARLLPLVDLIQEGEASSDAIRYLFCIRDGPRERRAYKTLIPAYSTYIARSIASYIPPGGLSVFVPVVAGAHAGARLKVRAREHAAEHPEPGYTRDEYLPEYCTPFSHPEPREDLPLELRADPHANDEPAEATDRATLP